MKAHIITGTLVAGLFASAAGADPFSDAVLKQLSCTEPPSPVPLMSILADSGLIDPAKNLGADSLSCFALNRPISVAGLTVVSVCAFEEAPEIMKQRPDIFWRGPGTSPGQTFMIGTSASLPEAARWYADHLGTKHLSAAVNDKFPVVNGTVEISCTSWFAG